MHNHSTFIKTTLWIVAFIRVFSIDQYYLYISSLIKYIIHYVNKVIIDA